jgi:hypothetical protein
MFEVTTNDKGEAEKVAFFFSLFNAKNMIKTVKKNIKFFIHDFYIF